MQFILRSVPITLTWVMLVSVQSVLGEVHPAADDLVHWYRSCNASVSLSSCNLADAHRLCENYNDHLTKYLRDISSTPSSLVRLNGRLSYTLIEDLVFALTNEELRKVEARMVEPNTSESASVVTSKCQFGFEPYFGTARVDMTSSFKGDHRIYLDDNRTFPIGKVLGQQLPVLDPNLSVSVKGFISTLATPQQVGADATEFESEQFYVFDSPILCQRGKPALGEVQKLESNKCSIAETENNAGPRQLSDTELRNVALTGRTHWEPRRLYQSLSWTTSKQRVILMRVNPSNALSLEDATDAQIQTAADTVRAFYLEASGGKLEFEFHLYPHNLGISHYTMTSGETSTRYCCAYGCSRPSTSSIMSQAQQALSAREGGGYINTFDRYVVILPQCNTISFGGSASVLGPNVWLNGYPNADRFAKVLAHELGHTIGAYHAEFSDQEYGNYYSVMGGALRVPDAHFSAAGKYAFGWLTPQQVVTMRREGWTDGRCDVLPANAACVHTTSIWLSAHDRGDGGAYDGSAKYGVRILTTDADEALWVEFRDKYFDDLAKGVVMTWTVESPYPDGTQIGTYGPTNLVDAISSSTHASDVALQPGYIFVYDLDRTAVTIKVLELDQDGHRVKVEVNFVEPTTSKKYQKSSTLSGRSGGKMSELGELECGKTSLLSVAASEEQSAMIVQLDHPTKLDFTTATGTLSASTCNSLGSDAGIYVYHTYPLQLELASPGKRHPGIGAAVFIPLSCGNSESEWSHGIKDFYSSKDVGYVRFSSTNYVVLWTGSQVQTQVDMSVAVACENLYCDQGWYMDNAFRSCFECPEGTTSLEGSVGEDSCFRDCDVISLSSSVSSSLHGPYAKVGSMNGAPYFRQLNGNQDVYLYLNRFKSYWYIGSDRWGYVQDYIPIPTDLRGRMLHPSSYRDSDPQSGVRYGEYSFSCACDNPTQYMETNAQSGCGECSPGTQADVDGEGPESCYVRCSSVTVTGDATDYVGVYTELNDNKVARFNPLSPILVREDGNMYLWRKGHTWFWGPDLSGNAHLYYSWLSVFATDAPWPHLVPQGSWKFATSSATVPALEIKCVAGTELAKGWDKSTAPTSSPSRTPTYSPTPNRTLPPVVTCAEPEVVSECHKMKRSRRRCGGSRSCVWCSAQRRCVPGKNTREACVSRKRSFDYYSICPPPPTPPKCPRRTSICNRASKRKCRSRRYRRFGCKLCNGNCNTATSCAELEKYSHCLAK